MDVLQLTGGRADHDDAPAKRGAWDDSVVDVREGVGLHRAGRSGEVDPLGPRVEQRSQPRRREARASRCRHGEALQTLDRFGHVTDGAVVIDGEEGAPDADAGLALHLRPAEHVALPVGVGGDAGHHRSTSRPPHRVEQPEVVGLVRLAGEHEIKRDRPCTGLAETVDHHGIDAAGIGEQAKPLPARRIDADDHDARPRLLGAADREARVDRLQLEVATDAGVPRPVPCEQPEQRDGEHRRGQPAPRGQRRGSPS